MTPLAVERSDNDIEYVVEVPKGFSNVDYENAYFKSAKVVSS